jgi:regulator of replication initiation timing
MSDNLEVTLVRLETDVSYIKSGIEDLKKNQARLIEKEDEFRKEMDDKYRELDKEIVQIKTWQKVKDTTITVVLGFIIFFKDIVKDWMFG